MPQTFPGRLRCGPARPAGLGRAWVCSSLRVREEVLVTCSMPVLNDLPIIYGFFARICRCAQPGPSWSSRHQSSDNRQAVLENRQIGQSLRSSPKPNPLPVYHHLRGICYGCATNPSPNIFQDPATLDWQPIVKVEHYQAEFHWAPSRAKGRPAAVQNWRQGVRHSFSLPDL